MKVIHREHGVIPGCLPAVDSFKEFDERAYNRSVDRYCREIQEYIKKMNEIRAGV